MSKIYLSDDKKQVVLLRKLFTIKVQCDSMQNGLGFPELSEEELDSAYNISKYCNNNIKLQLKKCSVFGTLSSKEEDEEINASSNSFILRKTTDSGCVLAGEEASVALQELKRLNTCPKIQKALETGKSIIIW